MLYTRKGDNGTTKLFNSTQGVRHLKSAPVFEALGTLDELNASLGYAKVLATKSGDTVGIKGVKTSYETIINQLQNILFTIQAELGGADKKITDEAVLFAELVTAEIETLLPPIHSFTVYGGGETGAYLDICRSIARRAERMIIVCLEKEPHQIGETTLRFMNRLSSVLYAMARFANYQEGFSEHAPQYE